MGVVGRTSGHSWVFRRPAGPGGAMRRGAAEVSGHEPVCGEPGRAASSPGDQTPLPPFPCAVGISSRPRPSTLFVVFK